MRPEFIPILLLVGVFLLKPKKANANTQALPSVEGEILSIDYSPPAELTPPPTVVTNTPNIVYSGNLPRGIRNNNPGNIRLTSDQWQGMADAQTDGSFVQFVSPQYGFRAMTRVLRNYERQGINTVNTIISRWAPSNENHTAAYVRYVTNYLGIAANNELDLSRFLLPLIKAITIYENGPDYARYYSDKTIREGIALA